MSDWNTESASMREVYSRSYCNLAATAATDSTKGIFCDRNPAISIATPLDVCIKHLNGGEESELDTRDVLNPLWWSNAVMKCPLNSRGWVLQERLLCPRMLYFGPDQLYWECREIDAAETFPTGLPEIYQVSGFATSRTSLPTRRIIGMASSIQIRMVHITDAGNGSERFTRIQYLRYHQTSLLRFPASPAILLL